MTHFRPIFSIFFQGFSVISLNDNEILSDDKFSLGGRWLRGFDVSGAGPRNSASSYVGGENLFVTKFDYSREILDNSDFPIYLNLLNDYGMVWQNKNKPINNDNYLLSLEIFKDLDLIKLSHGKKKHVIIKLTN